MLKKLAIAFGAAALMASFSGGTATAEAPSAPERGDVGAQCVSSSPEEDRPGINKTVHVQYGGCDAHWEGVLVSLDTSEGKGHYKCKPLNADGYAEFIVGDWVTVHGSYYC